LSPEYPDNFLSLEPYQLNKKEKQTFLNSILFDLTKHHYQTCPEYKNMLDGYGFSIEYPVESYYDIPFLPVRLFKELDLKSIAESDIFKTMTSSGTTGQQVSKIYLDRETASLQQKILVKIVSSFLGSSRLPMIIIDCPSVVNNRAMFSARGAGILGFSIFGADRVYALNDDMELDIDAVHAFLEKHRGKKILVFGFTFMIFKHFYKKLVELGEKLDLSASVLFHGGGWKKLISESISSQQFKACLHDVCGISEVHDYYGMVEQTGCIYVECEKGHLHSSVFSDVITRRALDLSPCEFGEQGIIEVVSVIPKSYCGHALLTEDEGTILGEDDCPCGRNGKYFKVSGRIAQAELRGCSDTYAASI
jgi:phenylacetate-coenzyme A ligase PaaK-like adenylate-forming protein